MILIIAGFVFLGLPFFLAETLWCLSGYLEQKEEERRNVSSTANR